MQSSIIKLDLKKLEKQVADIDLISKEQNWSYNYDEELDFLYFSPKQIKNGYNLFSVGNDFSVYVDKNSNLGGVFIEYYRSNLSSHEEKFKPFKNLFIRASESKKDLVIKKKQLSETLKAEILSELVKTNTNTINLAI